MHVTKLSSHQVNKPNHPKMSRHRLLGNYAETEEDNWDDLADNNNNLDTVLRTSIYLNASSQSSPIKGPSPTKMKPGKSPTKKQPYQSISLAEFESAMGKDGVESLNHTVKLKKLKNALKALGADLEHATLNKDIMAGFGGLDLNGDDDGDDSGMMTLKRPSKKGFGNRFPDFEESDMEDGLEFPESFNIPKKNGSLVHSNIGNFGTTLVVKPPNNYYSSTLDLSPANSSFGSNQHDTSSSSAASAYSEAATDATDFYNDIELETDDFERLLELRLKKAKFQAELEEKAFYLTQKQKQHSRLPDRKRSLARKVNIGTVDVLNLPDDSYIPEQPSYESFADGSESEENEGDFLEDFQDFDEDLSFAISKERDLHKNVIVRSHGIKELEHSIMNDPNIMKFYNNRTGSQMGTLVMGKARKLVNEPQDKLAKKRSMPVLRFSPTKSSPNLRNTSVALTGTPKERKKKLVSLPINNRVFGTGNELDELADLEVDYNRERHYLRSYGTLKGSPDRLIDISQYMEPELRAQPKKSILKNKAKHQERPTKKKKPRKLGLIKHLNQTQSPYVVEGYGGNKMVYNPKKYKWEGNEVDSRKFASIKPSKQPALITFLNNKKPTGYGHGTVKPVKKKNANGIKITSQDDSDFEELSMDGLQVEGNMYFNPKKLCWITLHDDSEEEEDPFKNILDLDVAEDLKHESPIKRPNIRGLSHSRLHADFKSSQYTNVTNYSPAMTHPSSFNQNRSVSNKPLFVGEFEVRGEFKIPEELVRKFQLEEERWIKKTRNWFQPGGDEELSDRDYLYEIRNMVMGGK